MKNDNQKKKHYELEKEFADWKDPEDTLLRILGFPEEKIHALRDYDHGWFVNDTRKRNDNGDSLFPPSYFEYQPYASRRTVRSFLDLLDSIENESILLWLKKADPVLQKIIMYRYHNVSISDISRILNIKPYTIYKKIQRFRKLLK